MERITDMLIYEKNSLSVYGDKEDIKNDAEKMSSFNEQLDSDYEWFKDRARILEGNYIKYCNNETFVGDAADASKKFIMDGQCGELHAKNILIKKEFVETCFDIEELFKGMVDASPHARISTKVLLKIKKDFGVYYALIDTKGFEIERRTSRLVNDYSKWGITTIPNYNKPYVVLEAFCDNGGFLDECIRKLEDFDRDAYNYINGKDFITRAEALKTKINNTAGALGSMTVYQPNIKKQSVSLISLSTMTNGVAALNSLAADGQVITYGQMTVSAMNEIKAIAKEFLLAADYAMAEIDQILLELPRMLSEADGPYPIGDLIGLGVLVFDAVILSILIADYLAEKHIHFSKPKGKGKSKDKTKDKNKEKPHRKNKDGEPLGKNGPQMDPRTIWQRGKTERVDVENPNPGGGNGNVHYHDGQDTKYIFDPVDGKFYLDEDPYLEAPPRIQKMLEDPLIQDAIDKALKYLGEPPYFK